MHSNHPAQSASIHIGGATTRIVFEIAVTLLMFSLPARMTQGLAQAPNSARDYFRRGFERQSIGKTQSAIDDYTKALDLDPKLLDALLNRSSLLRQEGRLDDALADASRALQLDGQRAKCWSNRALVLIELRDFAAAVADCTRALHARPAA